ncbi:MULTISPECIES: ABC transporter ATP-binding protein [unclassified Streptomyces]|uniref:ABC transporter ATP-binding protein n=1 Tax=unclassified Streptomyces TaxID=2593676 RepID=UPI001BEA60A4|nr:MULTISPECIES: ABC transporter ATP-binding protein [unclassified Streptomyces]MBT2406299.1 ABC transporter ATP-binding protein [Streptomyces sp. ISL-21]MBT2607384.1 ABC transporter ATP-binding protein [Streptomyces sp. ISL-87]
MAERSPSHDAVILLENVTRRYPGPHGDVVALARIDLSVRQGEIFGLLGPNGAGKTTMIETLVGLRRPTSGTVRVLGYDPVAQRDEIRKYVAIQPQHAAVFEQQTVAELLRVWASLYPDPETPDAIIDRMGLTASRDVRISKLSGGQHQRLLVGTALISRPRLLVLDEPSTGMDPNARQELWDAIRAHRGVGGTVLLSTHSMEEAETLCDRVAVLHKGRLAACGTPQDLISTHAPEREVHFTVPASTDLAPLRTTPGVSRIESHDSGGDTRVILRTSDSDAAFGLLAGPLGARHIQIKEAGLEAVFRLLTGVSFHEAGGDTQPTEPKAVMA